MAKTLKDARTTTKNARKDLPVGVHWRSLDPEVHVGYRKGKRGGVWLVRWRNGKGYRQAPIGTADDTFKKGTFDYDAACKESRKIVEKERAKAAAEAAGPVLTVRSAVEAYVAVRDARDSRRAGRPKRSDASQRLGRYVIGQNARGKQEAVLASPIADIPLHSLTKSNLLSWRASLPEAIKPTTRQRLINDLKAALNAAWTKYSDDLAKVAPTLPAIIKDGLKAEAREDDDEPVARDNQILTDAQVASLIRAAHEIDAEQDWDGDLYRLVLVLAATGARFSQVARLRVGDVQIAEKRLMVPVSRKGRGGKSGSITVPVGDDVIEALIPVTKGRRPEDPLLERWRHSQIKGSMAWQRAGRGPWQSSSELVRPWQAIRERAGLAEAVPYALRHSSVVRGIRTNLPIRLVAALHDTSTAMIEKHYARWITSGLEDMARTAIVPLAPDDDRKVVHLQAGA
jgi:integrase